MLQVDLIYESENKIHMYIHILFIICFHIFNRECFLTIVWVKYHFVHPPRRKHLIDSQGLESIWERWKPVAPWPPYRNSSCCNQYIIMLVHKTSSMHTLFQQRWNKLDNSGFPFPLNNMHFRLDCKKETFSNSKSMNAFEARSMITLKICSGTAYHGFKTFILPQKAQPTVYHHEIVEKRQTFRKDESSKQEQEKQRKCSPCMSNDHSPTQPCHEPK